MHKLRAYTINYTQVKINVKQNALKRRRVHYEVHYAFVIKLTN